ncbi:hypothetical protein [Marinobacterium sp. MBR-109]|jgi:hypothetical protein|uniref:hypothetical protein n=1 Tax=Marinobacterium sp. MBR-109 TaxID=3156462 RepID=UPI003393C214
MQIQSHNLQLASERNYSRSEERHEHLRVGRVSQDPVTGARQVDTLFEASQSERRELLTYSASLAMNADNRSDEPESRIAALTQNAPLESAAETAPAEAPFELRLEAADQLKLELISRLHKAITGKEIRLQLIDPAVFQPAAGAEISTPTPTAAPAAAPSEAPAEPQIGLEYQRHSRIHEQEATRFEASGQVTTRDGRRIDISLSLQMARSITQEEHEILRIGARLSDPLVINFNGDAAQLSQTRFEFDLDLDGQADQVPTLAGNRAFLALDRNSDGVINDGSELFGARSGNGFAELARFDEDGNGFIDAGDSVFSRLRLWSPGAAGQGSLMTLASQNIGAIWLNAADTEFSLTSGMTESRLGLIRSSSIFLSEDGRVGTVQHVDLSI